jgi:hypothetical protein
MQNNVILLWQDNNKAAEQEKILKPKNNKMVLKAAADRTPDHER